MNKKLPMLLLGCLLTGPVVAEESVVPAEGVMLKLDEHLGGAAVAEVMPPELHSPIVMIYDEEQQRPLYARNDDAVAPIASISKLMMAMAVLDAGLSMNEEIRITRSDMVDNFEGSHSRMRPGMVLRRSELLRLALMASENRAAAALARTYPGGARAAVAAMNAKARELEMTDTHFADPTGLSSDNVSTARDLVKLVLAAEEYELIRTATTTPVHQVRPIGHRPMWFGNTNPLVRNASWHIGVSKTGYISESGRCLVMKADINSRRVVIVLLDSTSKRARIEDANRIRDWMENFGISASVESTERQL